MNSMGEIQSLARGLTILEKLAQEESSLSITELAVMLGVNKSTASRLAKTLLQHGFVEKAADERSYCLGPMLVSLSRKVITRLPLREAAKPYLQMLVAESGECAHLAVHLRGKALYIDQAESPSSLRVNVEVGQLAPLHCTALGKVLLAFSDLPLPIPLEPYTPRTIIDPVVLAAELGRVRQQGFAVDDQEFDSNVRCIAAPVFDYRSKLVGAMGISGPAARLSKERISDLAPRVVDIARQLSDRLKFKHST